VATNGGPRTFDHFAMLKIFPIKVVTIFSMKDVASILGARLIMDTQLKQSIIVEACGKIIKFVECDTGFYYHDTSKDLKGMVNKHNNTSVTGYNFLKAIKQSESLYTKNQVS